ncbi:MAG: FAD/NAD(P)-binding protein [Paracoccus sp. (in: a-proteobacteria)]
MSVVAIIGGGFTGALTAWHLARHAPDAQIVVIEPRDKLGAGLAYSTADPSHRINVPASRMTMRTDIRDGLHRWIEAEAIPLSEGSVTPEGALFPQRGIVADYVAQALAPDLAQGRIRHLRTRATGLSHSDRFRITLEDGTALRADHVVIATSHPPPALPASLASLRHDPRLIADPSDAGAITAAALTRRVMVLGTGLTSADVIASLDRQGFRGAILALSRRGQRSRGHAVGYDESPADFAATPAQTALALLRRVRAEVARDAASGLPWQATLDNVRRDGAAIWAALPLSERTRLVHRLRVWWDVHRFRIAPQVEAALDRLIAEDRLRIRAGHLKNIEADEAGLIVTWAPKGRTSRREVFDRVILTTGPAHDRIIAGSPLLTSAEADGLVRADPLGLGLDVTNGCCAVGTTGAPVPGLWIAGPLARGHVGELMGIPEVTAHAELVADRLAEAIAARQLQARTA